MFVNEGKEKKSPKVNYKPGYSTNIPIDNEKNQDNLFKGTYHNKFRDPNLMIDKKTKLESIETYKNLKRT